MNLQQRNLAGVVCGLFITAASSASAQTFYPDDPVWKEPPPRDARDVKKRKLNPLVDFYKNTVYKKGERNSRDRVYPSQGANTLGELPDSIWFTNRHDRTHRISPEALRVGPNHTGAPSMDAPWTIVSAKAEGVTPGFQIEDAKSRKYFLKFDPISNPEMATAADVICAKFLHAIGYNVPENYIVYFKPEQLQIKPGLKFDDRSGRTRSMRPRDVSELLRTIAQDKDGRIRAVASYELPGEGVGNFKYYKRRDDDPNEIAPHEHLRVLRGLYVFAAWLNQTDAKALNTYDAVVTEDGRRFIRHYLLDFGSALGSDAIYAKDPRLGHEYMVDPKPGLRNLIALGLYVPHYARAHYPSSDAVGHISSEAFDPERWKPNYPNAAFISRLPGDEFWAAKKVMAFTDDDIRTIVQTAQYSDPSSVELMTRILAKRRDLIGRAFFKKLLPIDAIRIDDSELRFDDLAAIYKFRAPLQYDVQWANFDNQRGLTTPIASAKTMRVPEALSSGAAGSYCAAIISAPNSSMAVTAYFRRETGWKLVGIQRQGSDRWEPTE